MLFTRDKPKPYGTSRNMHWKTGAKMFLKALFLIETNKQEKLDTTQIKCPSIGKRLNTLWCINLLVQYNQ